MVEIKNLTIKNIHDSLIKKEYTCLELVNSYFENIEKLNSTYNVFSSLCKEEALEKAKIVDKKINGGEEIKLLEGIPFSVKDAICTIDGNTQAGSNIIKGFKSSFNATVVEKLLNEGAILIGKTNCDSFGHGSSTKNCAYGVVKNPFSLDHVAGGSSGGAAASVTLNMCTFAIGEDTGGSIREPASFCNVYGLKPSYGRNSRYGAISYGSSLDTIGPIANNINDIEIIENIIKGIDEKDVTTLKSEQVRARLIWHVQEANEQVIGVVKEFMGEGLDPEIKKLFDKKIEEYKNKGFKIKEISIPSIKYAVATYYLIACSETASNLSKFDGVKYGIRSDDKKLDDMYRNTREMGFSFETKKRIILGTYSLSAGYNDKYYKKACTARGLIKEEIEAAFKNVDIILVPSSPVLPFEINPKTEMDPMAEYLSDIYTVVPSLAGICSLNIPIGFVGKLPVGMQIIGNVLEEEKIIEFAKE